MGGGALDLAASDKLRPEFALLFVLIGLKWTSCVALEISAAAAVLADAFERRLMRRQQLTLPPVIV